MKKVSVLIIIMLFVCGLCSGCGGIKELTDEESERISEYAAMLLLKYDANYSNALLEEEKKEEEEEKKEKEAEEEKQEPVQEPETVSGDAVEPDNNTPPAEPERKLNEVFGFPNIEINYSGCIFTKVFPENGVEGYSVQSGQGKKLLILKLQIKNTGSEAATVDILSGNPSVRIHFNNEEVVAKMTIIPEDFGTFCGEIPAGGTTEKVLVGEVSEGFNEQLESLFLTIRFQDKTSQTTLVP